MLSGGRCCPADSLRVFERLKWLYFEVVRISAKKSKDFKKCDVIQFLHIFSWADFVRFSAVKSLQGFAIAIYNADFR